MLSVMTAAERAQRKPPNKKAIAEIHERLPTLKEAAKPVAPDTAIGRLSRMEAINAKGVRDAALHETKERLKRLQERMERIDDANFGLCAGCSQPILFARLLYIPDTDRCVRCAGG